MMEKENIKAFMLYGIDEETTFKECIKNEMLIIFISILEIIINMKNIVFIILGILPSIIYLITVLRLGEEGTFKGMLNILHDGVFSVCLSYIFAMISIKLVFSLYMGAERILVICMIVLGYMAVILLFRHIIRKNIKENVYGDDAKKIKAVPFSAVPAALGMIAGRILFKNMGERSGTKLACILFLFISFVTFTGIFNIFKYKYLMEHKELLEDLDKDKKRAKQKAETGENYEPKENKRKHQSHGKH